MNKSLKLDLRAQSRPLVMGLLAATLAACGGGGGGGGFYFPVSSSSGGAVPLTSANRDAAAHAVVGGALGLGGVDQTLPAAAALGKQVQRVASQKSTTQIQGKPEACPFGGTLEESIDDRDGNGAPSVGDVITIVYSQCRDTASSMTNGTTTAELQAISDTSLRMRMTSTQLLMDQGSSSDPVQAHHKVTMDGPMTVDYTIQSATTAQMRIVTETVTMALQTPVFTDTVTLRPGFDEVFTDDTSALPSGGGTPGRGSATMNGRLQSSAVGGELVVSTDASFDAYAGDRFPRAGVIRALGSTGTLRVTAISTSQVRVELDADGDANFEDAQTQSWDWLI